MNNVGDNVGDNGVDNLGDLKATVLIDKAAEMLNVSRRTVYNHISRGWLETKRTAGQPSQRIFVWSLLSLKRRRPRGTRGTRIRKINPDQIELQVGKAGVESVHA